MCGIIAYISRKNKKIDKQKLLSSGNKMSHRGPDAQGIFINDWIGLFHNRLSIIDPFERANQPMLSRDNRYVIVYNGEIYNYKELKKELMDYNSKFYTNSDTEVLLNAYIRFSKNCLNKLRGMFAFIIYDKKKNEVFAARDPLGIKPLYIYEGDECIILSSEIKAMTVFVDLAPAYDKYIEQLMFRDISGCDTCYKYIRRLLPGSFFLYTKDNDMVERGKYHYLYTTFCEGKSLKNMTEEDIIEQAGEVLVDSIKVHTYSDVGYNLQLSGGIDSSLVAAILRKKIGHSNLTSYSVILNDQRCDESRYQDIVADALDLEKYQVEIDNKIFTDNLERATYFLEKPIVHPGSVCLFYLTRHSVRNSKVILTGEGADEVFGGYPRYNIPFKLYLLMFFQSLGLHRIIYPFVEYLDILKRLYFKIKGDQLLEYSSLYSWYEAERLLGREPLPEKDASFRKGLFNDSAKKDIHSRLLYYDQMTYLSTLLDRQDKLSMANSVEARVPYADIKVYKFLNSIPSYIKFRKNRFKYILTRVAERYLPKEIIYRRKNGLNLPIKEWFKDKKLLGRYLDMLLDNTTKKRGIYDVRYLEYMVKMQESGKKDFAVKLMMLVNFELWHRIFFK